MISKLVKIFSVMASIVASPALLALRSDASLLVSNENTASVIAFNEQGASLGTFAQVPEEGNGNHSEQLTIGPNGNLYAANAVPSPNGQG